jgi:hypothetical protein
MNASDLCLGVGWHCSTGNENLFTKRKAITDILGYDKGRANCSNEPLHKFF